jgi:hypothetical protein
MGEIIELNNYKDMTPSFCISAQLMADGSWAIQVNDFYDDRMDSHAVFREIAEALIPIAGGLIHNAEELEPTKRGCIISNITIYTDGHIDYHTRPLDTPERKAWFLAALSKIRSHVRKG